jgi:hypothetical protein
VAEETEEVEEVEEVEETEEVEVGVEVGVGVALRMQRRVFLISSALLGVWSSYQSGTRSVSPSKTSRWSKLAASLQRETTVCGDWRGS